MSARKGCKGSVGGCRGGRLLAVEPISSHFSRLTYENLNLRMQNGSWTRHHKTTQREARDESAATPPTLTLPLSLPPRAELSACKCVCNGLNMLDRPLSNMHMHCVCVCGCVWVCERVLPLPAPPPPPLLAFCLRWLWVKEVKRGRGVRHEKLKRDFGAAAAEKRLNSNSNNFFRPHSRMGRTPVSVFRKCLPYTQRVCVCVRGRREVRRGNASWKMI